MWDNATIMMLVEGTFVTLYMTLVSTFMGYVLGLPMGIALVITAPKGLRPNKIIYKILDVIVNNLPLYYGYVYYQDKCVNSWKEEKHSRNRICLIDSETSLVNGLDVLTNVFTLRAGFGQEILNEKIRQIGRAHV